MKIIKDTIKKGFNRCGIDLKKLGIQPPSPLVHHRIDLLLDVGANTGQYSALTRRDGYGGRIVSFEPLPYAYRELKRVSENDSKWVIHPRCAIGSSLGKSIINISKNSHSSSLLSMLPSHSKAAPDSIYIDSCEVDVVTLDSVFNDYVTNKEKVYIKIDTQGFEADVLKGMENCLQQVSVVQIELSIVPLYEGQELYSFFFDYLTAAGFNLWSIIPGFSDKEIGRLLQFDAIFIRDD